MADNSSFEGSNSHETLESTMEINIKTLDSQMYKCHADKEMLVSTFKEKIASQIGVPMEQQRLIFRGKVLKDTHLLSEYHLENGDTLHLVLRQPSQGQPSSSSNIGNATSNNHERGQELGLGAPRGRVGQISHSVVLGTFNVGEQSEGGGVPDLNQVIGAVLNSFGVGNLAGAQPNMTFNSAIQNPQTTGTGTRTGTGTGTGTRSGTGTGTGTGTQSQTRNQTQPGHPFSGQSFPRVVQIPLGATVAVPSFNMPIPDSVNTLSEFISRMEEALSQHTGNQQRQSPNDNVNIPRTELPSNRGVPTPDALGLVIRQAEHLITGPTAGSLSRIAGRLEQEAGSTDPSVRTQIQTESVQVGLAMQHLGALFLELGRTILTLRMGNSPGESSVNAGPAVYISPFGPNPIMVQPFPLQMSSLFAGSAPNMHHPGPTGPNMHHPGTTGPVGVGVGSIPRNVNIHIHTGASMAPLAPGVGPRSTTGVASQGEQVTGTVFNGLSQALPVQNIGTTAIPLGPTVITMAGNGVGTPQPPADSVPLAAMLAEANSQLQSFVDNARNEGHVSSGPSESSNIQDRFEGRATINEPPSSSTETEHVKPEMPKVHSEEGSSVSCENTDIPDGSSSVPLGLGLGGLQPKRRVKRSSTQVNSAEGSSVTPNPTQQPRILGQQVLECLANLPGRSNVSTSVPEQPSHSTGAHTSDDEVDVSDALSQALQSPALSGLLAGVSQQTGIGSPNALMSMLEQITQSPAMRNTVNQIAQQIDSNDIGNMFSGMGGGGGGGQGGGLDISRMFQQMMPIVSQALGGVPGGLPSRLPVVVTDEVDVHSLGQRIGRESRAGEIFTSMVRNVAESREDEDAQQSVLNDLSSDQGLANDFVEMLRRDVARRLQEENGP